MDKKLETKITIDEPGFTKIRECVINAMKHNDGIFKIGTGERFLRIVLKVNPIMFMEEVPGEIIFGTQSHIITVTKQ